MFLVSQSDIGLKRSCNEDSVYVNSLDENTGFAVVCDGMGGAKAGNVASKMACDMISAKINMCYRKDMLMSSVMNMLLSAITTANVSIYDASCADENLKGMGTTVVCAFVHGTEVCIGHAGDSRAYVISKSGIRQLTKDHSLVQQMYDNGEISVEELRTHPVKNVITRALGVNEDIDIDITTYSLNDGEILLLCSDGLSNYVDADEIYQIVNNNGIENIAKLLVDRANQNGGGDNITVAAIC